MHLDNVTKQRASNQCTLADGGSAEIIASEKAFSPGALRQKILTEIFLSSFCTDPVYFFLNIE